LSVVAAMATDSEVQIVVTEINTAMTLDKFIFR
jgi:hypothetical protein